MTVPIAHSFEVLARGPAATPAAIARAATLGASLDYAEVVRVGADLELKHESGLDVRIWAPDFVVEMNFASEIDRWLPGCVAVGDADGLMLIECPNGLFAFGGGALDVEDATWIAPDLIDLLAGHLGGLGPERP